MSGFSRRLHQAAAQQSTGFVWPNATNTGVPAGTSLTVVNGDLTITTDGAVVSGQDVHGFIIINANNVTVQNCLVRGRSTSSNAQLVSVASGKSSILVQDCELANEFPTPLIDGMGVHGTTIKRLNIHGTTDGLKASSNSVIEDCYIHDMTYFTSDPNQGGGASHNDAIQILSGSNITIHHNTLMPGADANSAIQITQDFGAVSNVYITDNLADWGHVVFNFSHKGGSAMTINASNNRFGHDSDYDVGILISTQTTLVGSGNVWDDNGQPTTIQQHD